MRLCSALLALGVVLAPSALHGQACPEPLAGAQRLVLVTVPSMGSAAAATMRLFERPEGDASWRLVQAAEPAMLGARGAAWGAGFHHLARDGEPVKREGDQRTPAGLYALGPSFGFAASPLPGYRQLDAGTVCVDDPASSAYNTITSRAIVGAAVSAENMRRSPLYRRGIVVQYPTDRAARAGSCIFIHLWKNPTSGTAGCIALPEARVAALQDFATRPAVLAVLPESTLARLSGCLPSIDATAR
jgi:L,D-peptidoglycan transpeptidase YkuD (ErfK/YbiS/YcfS/YnhG family)